MSSSKPATSTDRLARCISIDLEVAKASNRIHAFAGVRSDTGRCITRSSGDRDPEPGLAELDELSEGAEFVLGHNLIKFDLPRLREERPSLHLLQLPVIDTLWISPLAFPKHPYHRLVKHYKDGQLNREKPNDPELDARLTLKVFADQQKQLLETPPHLLIAWHWLTTQSDETGESGGTGFDLLFESLRRSPRPDINEAREAVRQSLDGRSCHQKLRSITADLAEHGWGLAYALAWISVSGGNSVLPPWVRHSFVAAAELVRRLRDEACGHRSCDWCRRHHDPVSELNRWFGFEQFRPEPVDPDTQQPMQQAIVETAMHNQDALAILPTGTGKSLCYQLPALSRYNKTGAMTVVISPLVALMADQVAGLEKLGVTTCVTVNGTLSMPERTEALKKVRLGDAAILLISPEQLRSVPVRKALEQRETGLWVLDEAHCLSKWGHDFRPDYRYVGRFIREKAAHSRIPPVLCLTATAKPEVKTEIQDYFREHLGIDIDVFDGGSRRTNLNFTVLETTESSKFHDIVTLLNQHLPEDTAGGAIVYCATRRRTEEVADFLTEQGIEADHFHAGLQPEAKKNVQQSFINGDLRVIAATNAFGMGIDKPDVRLVIHADIPASLENYLQEAGRAGRDQQQAHCILLYTEEDVERQFGMSARSRLTRREIHGVLRALRYLEFRNRRHSRGEPVIATTGEILAEDQDGDITRDKATDDTRVRTAVAWLEEADLLTREENEVRVFPSSLNIHSVDDARARLQTQQIDDDYREALTAMARTLLYAAPDEGITTDTMMEVSGLTPDRVRTALFDLERFGIARTDTVLTAFVHVGTRLPSRRRLTDAIAVEKRLIELMQAMAPDMGRNDSAPLNLRIASQRLKDADLGHVRTEHVTRSLQGIARDGRNDGGTSTRRSGGSITISNHNSENVWLTLNRDWSSLAEMADRRRQGAQLLLAHLLSELAPNQRGQDLLVKTTLERLLKVIEDDLVLRSQTTNPQQLMERALLWLHEQEVIRLNRGLTVFRPAMTITLTPGKQGFKQQDFKDLQHHYDRTVRQIHVMAEFAEKGRTAIAEAVRLSVDYFELGEDDFIRRWLPERRHELSRETTPESWDRIVESLNNPTQRRLVTDDRETDNTLVLAGPGSGKTRVLVHRIAYLVRVRRQNPRSILALAYNRHAAVEIRNRLAGLIGNDAKGVTVLTCHALAMRLVGASFSGKSDLRDGEELKTLLDDVMDQAIDYLQGTEFAPEEDPSEAEQSEQTEQSEIERAEIEQARARLLAGFRWILVDEYQDIGRREYDLISALAGQTITDVDARPNLLAVGDDDQNIYAFNGSSVEFIRSFNKDYGAEPTYLIENYRSSRHIIDAANTVISPATDRMKTGHEIRIDHQRTHDRPGGVWEALDPVARGRVQILPSDDDIYSQARHAVTELNRLSGLVPDWDWSRCAVIAAEWSHLEPVRSLCEHLNIPVQKANETEMSLWRLRETQALVRKARGSNLVDISGLREWIRRQRPSPWFELLDQALDEHQVESGSAKVPNTALIEWLAEWCRGARRRQRGLLLLTAHRAKGLEFDHVIVLDGGWDRRNRGDDADAQRRLYYVAMTRARQTLALLRRKEPHPFHTGLHHRPSVLLRETTTSPRPGPELTRRHRQLALNEVFLSFAGNKPPEDHLHTAIAALSPGDRVQVNQDEQPWKLLNQAGTTVGILAQSFKPPDNMVFTNATVAAIATWGKDRSDAKYLDRVMCENWEVVLPELTFEPGGTTHHV